MKQNHEGMQWGMRMRLSVSKSQIALQYIHMKPQAAQLVITIQSMYLVYLSLLYHCGIGSHVLWHVLLDFMSFQR